MLIIYMNKSHINFKRSEDVYDLAYGMPFNEGAEVGSTDK